MAGLRPRAPTLTCAMSMIPNGIVTSRRACRSFGGSVAKGMKKISYSGYRFPPEAVTAACFNDAKLPASNFQ